MKTMHAYSVLFVSALFLIASLTFYADAQDSKKARACARVRTLGT